MMFHLRNLLLAALVCSLLASVAEARGRRKARKGGGAPTTINNYMQYPQPNEPQVPPPPPGSPPPYELMGKPGQTPSWTNRGSLPTQTQTGTPYSGGSFMQTQASQSISSQVFKPVEPTAGKPVIQAVEPHATGQNELLVRGENFGTQNGQVMLQVNGVQIGLEAIAWTPNAIIVKTPVVQIAPNATVEFTITRADGVANPPTRLASQ